MNEFVRTGQAAGIATITLDSPRNRNALSAAGAHEVIDAVADCEHSIDAVEARIRNDERP